MTMLPGNKKLRSDHVRQLWAAMHAIYKSRVVDKKSSRDMQVVGWFLDTLGIVDKKKFLSTFTTTIGRTIYTPFEVGEATALYPLWKQVLICAHEHMHIEQLKRDGWVSFTWGYLTSSTKRAAYEAEAYRTNMELEFWRMGEMPNPHVLAKKLENYGCSNLEIMTTARYLSSAAITIRHGGIVSRPVVYVTDQLHSYI